MKKHILLLLALVLCLGLAGCGRKAAGPADLSKVYAAADPYTNADGTVPEAQVQDAIDAVYKAALKDPAVLSCSKDEYSVLMEVAEGPDHLYIPLIEGMDSGSGPLEIVTLQPYNEENRVEKEEYGYVHDLDAPDTVAEALAQSQPDLWRFERIDDVNDDEVTLERILSLGGSKVILWQGHGGYSKKRGYCLSTSIPWSENLAETYGLDESNSFRINVTDYVGLRPAFFSQNFEDGAFENAFIYLGTCFSGKDEEMARVLLDKGAAVVFVNSKTIGRGYNLNMLRLISESFLVGPQSPFCQDAIASLGDDYKLSRPNYWTIEDSLQLARACYGAVDHSHGLFGAKVSYICRPGMELTGRSTWLAGFDIIHTADPASSLEYSEPSVLPESSEPVEDRTHYAHILEMEDEFFTVKLLEPVEYEESFVNALRVGSRVDMGGYTAVVSEITADMQSGSNIYYLDDYSCILRVGNRWLLLWPSGALVMRDAGEHVLIAEPGLQIMDEVYAMEHGEAPRAWSVSEIRERYGEDLSIYTFELTVVDGEITEAFLRYNP